MATQQVDTTYAAPVAAAPETQHTATTEKAYTTQAPMTTTTPQHEDEVGEWVNRFKTALNKPEVITKHQGTQPWHTSFVEFFNPIDTCAITCCCPCVTFGKTHHRLRKDANMQNYSPFNTSCLGFFLGSYCCLTLPMMVLQRHDINSKYNLKSDFVVDVLKACCCGCCELVQQDKEAAYHALGNAGMVSTQPGAHGDMKMGA